MDANPTWIMIWRCWRWRLCVRAFKWCFWILTGQRSWVEWDSNGPQANF